MMSHAEPDVQEMTEARRLRFLRRLRFSPALEQAFRDDYDRKILPGLRGGLLLLLLVFVIQGISALALFHGVIWPVWISSAAILVLMLTTWHPRFASVWQPTVVATFCVLAYELVGSIAGQVPPPSVQGEGAVGAFRANTLLLNEMQVVIVGCALTRLRFGWFTAGSLTIAAITVFVALTTPGVPRSLFFGGAGIFAFPSLLALIFVAYLQERSARAEFLANYQLERARANEQGRRERTEGMLHVLSQAIGGIVHDLGNPLTSVRTGAETLQALKAEQETDKALEGEVLDIISDGALMLDYLRLSLLEQIRILEGKPIPLHQEAVSLRHIIEASGHFQKPRLTSGRAISAVGDDLTIWADEMKMITVFMNLLGNALKYSDGDIRIAWQRDHDQVVCAVMDRGRASVGITQAQAKQLFIAFGRLESYRDVEGTGLGLLSAQKIAEAHGGEIFIEGYVNGAPPSARFSTSRGTYLPMLEEDFRTAFVLVCPAGIGVSSFVHAV